MGRHGHHTRRVKGHLPFASSAIVATPEARCEASALLEFTAGDSGKAVFMSSLR